MKTIKIPGSPLWPGQKTNKFTEPILSSMADFAPGHERQHGHPHPGGLQQHEDVRHGRRVRSHHQHHQQFGEAEFSLPLVATYQ